jgi:hypothetical protein
LRKRIGAWLLPEPALAGLAILGHHIDRIGAIIFIDDSVRSASIEWLRDKKQRPVNADAGPHIS